MPDLIESRLAFVAHEIKNPLNFVNNFSEVTSELVDEMKDRFGPVPAEVHTLMDAVRQGPVELSMNDGQKLVIPSPEFCLVDDVAARARLLAQRATTKMTAADIAGAAADAAQRLRPPDARSGGLPRPA